MSEQERTGPGIPEEFLRDCEWSESPIYGCDHCRRNGTFDPSQYSFAPSNRTEPGSIRADGKYIRSEWPSDPSQTVSDLDLRKIVEGWQVNGRGSPSTKYARYELTERDRNPVDEAFQRGIFGKGRPGVENEL